MIITGIEAHFLLFAMDNYLGVDKDGKIKSVKHRFGHEALQNLRDRLFAAHEHPAWEEEDEQKRQLHCAMDESYDHHFDHHDIHNN